MIKHKSTMKKISKSEAMKRAWSIYRSGHSFYSLTFGTALARAWEVEKANIVYAEKQAAEQAELEERKNRKQTSIGFDMNMLANELINFYRSSVYHGD